MSNSLVSFRSRVRKDGVRACALTRFTVHPAKELHQPGSATLDMSSNPGDSPAPSPGWKAACN